MENHHHTNRISGRVFHKESGIGIANLIVEIYDVDPNTFNPDDDKIFTHPKTELKDETFQEANNPNSEESVEQGRLPIDRLGSVLTDTEGHFELNYLDEAFQIRQRYINDPDGVASHPENKLAPPEMRPDLYILVTAPETNEMTSFSNVVFRATRVRVNAGRQEYFLIQLTTNELEAAGLNLPFNTIDEPHEEPTPIPSYRERLSKTLLENYNKKQDVKKVFKPYFELRKKEILARQEDINEFCKSISNIPQHLRDNTQLFVSGKDSVSQKTKENIKLTLEKELSETSDKSSRKGVIHLTEEQKEKFFPSDTTEEWVEISEEDAKELETIMKGSEGEASNDLVYTHPLDFLCKNYTEDNKKILDLLGFTNSAEENEDETTTSESADFEPATPEDVPRYIARQIERAVSPETPVHFGVSDEQFLKNKRADQKIIEGSVGSLNLRQGPADTPMFFDFHQTFIAFEHIWQEAIDGEVVGIVEQFYDEIVERGGIIETPTWEGIRRDMKTADFEKQQNFSIGTTAKTVNNFSIDSVIWENSLKEETKVELRKIDNEIDIITDAMRIIHGIQGIRKNHEMKGSRINQLVSDLDDNPKINNHKESIFEHLPNYNDSNDNNDYYDIREEYAGPLVEQLSKERKDLFRSATSILSSAILNRREEEKKNQITGGDSYLERIADLERRLKEPYSFKYYAANSRERSINFGFVTTYRQKWEPLAYQAGELVKTIPLAPKEVKKYSKKEVIKKKRNVKENENSLSVLKEDSTETGRAEAEIMSKASTKANFSLSTEGSFGFFGLSEGSTTASTSLDYARDSSDQKKNFRESVKKAAQEYRNERKLEVTTEEIFESEFTESGEISNPNDELTVTYLFYELQRRYKVFERIHRVRPVIFVAQEMPKPEEIDEDWVIAHDWILRRVILDDSFYEGLNLINDSIIGKEASLDQMLENLSIQRGLVAQLKSQVKVLKENVEHRYLKFEEADGDNEKEKTLASYERTAKERDNVLAQLEREVSSLNAITERYNQTVSEYLNQKTQVQRVLIHIKENILHYMQAIWSYEPPDQRFFRLFNTEVPIIEGELKYKIKVAKYSNSFLDPIGADWNNGVSINEPTKTSHEIEVTPKLEIETEYTTLTQVADVDNLLGFKGNYMMFPLKKSNKLIDHLMIPFKDSITGLHDPHLLSEWSIEDFAKYVCCLKENLSETDFNDLVDSLRERYQKLASDPSKHGEEIIVPTGSLFIEALPGTHPILEDFKLAHRAIDVKKAQAEVREMELGNIRLAARLLNDERDDPDVDKKIVVEGNGVNNVIDVQND